MIHCVLQKLKIFVWFNNIWEVVRNLRNGRRQYYTFNFNLSTGKLLKTYRGCPRGVMVKAMDCGIVVSDFVLQSHYYVHFRANTLGKGMNPLILPAMG